MNFRKWDFFINISIPTHIAILVTFNINIFCPKLYHETVPEKLIDTRPIERIKAQSGDRDVELLKINKIKKYSPGVWHVVVDAKIN